MKSCPKVSVIVPCYNASATIKRCLDSLVNQTLEDIQILCIDDGSTDDTGIILDEYARKDERIIVVHKPNEGVSATRQKGLDMATGEYVIHLDSDDYADIHMYETMYQQAKDKAADIVICDIYKIDNTGQQYMSFAETDWSPEALVKRMFSWRLTSVWNQLIRRALIKKYHVTFPTNLNFGEDGFFMCSLICRAIDAGDCLNYVHVPKALIFYDCIANGNSLTRQPKKLLLQRLAQSYEMTGRIIDMKRFGESYYEHIKTVAFQVFWKPQEYDISNQEYSSLFQPFVDGIQEYARPGIKKKLTIKAIKNGINTANRYRCLMYPQILSDIVLSRLRSLM